MVMADRELVQEQTGAGPSTSDATSAPDVPVPGASTADEQQPPLLARMNERGFRLVMLADAFALFAVTVATMLYRFGTDWPDYPVGLYLASFTISVAVFIASLYFGGMYEREPRLGAPPILPRAARQTLGAGGLVALLTLVLTGVAREAGLTTARALPFPVTNLVVLILVGAVAVAFNRRLVHLVRTRREGPPRVVLFGDAAATELAREHLAAAGRAIIVAELSDPADLHAVVDAGDATDVMVLSGAHLDALYPEALDELDRVGVTALLRVGARETMYGLERLREVGGLPFVLLRSQTMPRSRARFKRLFDLVVLAITAIAWVPLLLAVATYQLIVAGRPLLYWQERVGAGGRPFQLVKFRTMQPDAESDGQGVRLAERDDPRIIPACRWIRASRMDELPQVFNVLRGEMSLVGPRPERPQLTAGFEQQIAGYGRRHEVPPGLTGLAQIHGRYHTDAEYKLGYDLQYLVNWSPVLDLEILFRTVWVVLTGRI
jgi:exopolysaccharide biosynthesis polyprenyl glycosylphosphotransferase